MKMKTRSASLGIFGRNASAMCLDDRANNGEAHPETFFFRGKELLKEPLTGCLRNPGAVIADGGADGAVAVVSRGDLDDSMRRRRVLHRFKGIAHEIEHCLLNLGGVTFNGRQFW